MHLKPVCSTDLSLSGLKWQRCFAIVPDVFPVIVAGTVLLS